MRKRAMKEFFAILSSLGYLIDLVLHILVVLNVSQYLALVYLIIIPLEQVTSWASSAPLEQVTSWASSED